MWGGGFWWSRGSPGARSPPQECPSGLVDEETFKLIYSQFFPQGGESRGDPRGRRGGFRGGAASGENAESRSRHGAGGSFTGSRLPPLADASTYAHFLFDAFDADRNGALCFQVSVPAPLPRPASRPAKPRRCRAPRAAAGCKRAQRRDSSDLLPHPRAVGDKSSAQRRRPKIFGLLDGGSLCRESSRHCGRGGWRGGRHRFYRGD